MNTFIQQESHNIDPTAEKLKGAAHNTVAIIFGLLPLFFIPLPAAPLGYSKILFIVAGLALALILYGLYVLRAGSVSIRFPYALGALWLVFFVSLLSTVLSGDFKDAFIGNTFSVHSTAFVGVLALAASVWVVIGASKASVMRLYFLLAASAVVLVIFHVLRLIFGADTLSFGVFVNAVATPLGGWNNLGLFLGLSVLLALVALEQLPLTRWGTYFFGVVAAFALLMLGIINFVYVWAVLALVGLVMLIYTVKRRPQHERTGDTLAPSARPGISSLALSLVVFVVSLFFLIGGSSVGSAINDFTGISFVEVRPSFQSTADIARDVYRENAFLGIGPNRFDDAWRQYKNEAINATQFWNTDFNAGSGYIPTSFVTTGMLGGIAWLLFIGTLIVTGMRMIFRPVSGDRLWYFVGVSAFVGAIYIWGMSFVYVPGPSILLLGGLCTGILFLANGALSEKLPRTFHFSNDRRMGFVSTLVVILIIVGSVGTLYAGSRHYAAAYVFNDALLASQRGTSLDTVEKKIVRAHELSESDLYVRRLAEYQLGRMQQLFALESPTKTQQQQFNQALTNGVNAGQLATKADGTEPANWAVLGQIYSLLVSGNVEGSYERAHSALERARDLDPNNPSRYLALANLEARAGNLDEARRLAEEAIEHKADYSDAFFFLTQLAVATGDVNEAAESAQATIALEPRNPARYYQLGILESARGELGAAVTAFEEAVRLDPDYANALYFLALSYDAQGRSEQAKTLLERVLELNPGNETVTALLEKLKTTGSLDTDFPETEPVTDDTTATNENDGVITTDEDPDSPLLTPVNVPAEGDSGGNETVSTSSENATSTNSAANATGTEAQGAGETAAE